MAESGSNWVWIAARKNDNTVWLNGSDLPLTFANWKSSVYESIDGVMCAILLPTGNWQAIDCTTDGTACYVCQESKFTNQNRRRFCTVLSAVVTLLKTV